MTSHAYCPTIPCTITIAAGDHMNINSEHKILNISICWGAQKERLPSFQNTHNIRLFWLTTDFFSKLSTIF